MNRPSIMPKRLVMETVPRLKAEGAPRFVLDAGAVIDDHVHLGLNPPKDVVNIVERWLAKERGNDRYGR